MITGRDVHPSISQVPDSLSTDRCPDVDPYTEGKGKSLAPGEGDRTTTLLGQGPAGTCLTWKYLLRDQQGPDLPEVEGDSG